jgi:hypothetical protein
MGILTDEMKRIVREQRLGYIATVCPDGTPNLSPKGTTAVWDDDHLVFADIRSPQSVQNIEHNPPSKSTSSIRSFAKVTDLRDWGRSIARTGSSSAGAKCIATRGLLMKSAR